MDSTINNKLRYKYRYYVISTAGEWTPENKILLTYKYQHILYDSLMINVIENHIVTYTKQYSLTDLSCELDSTLLN